MKVVVGLLYLLQLYHPLNIYIVLVGVETWNDGDQITVNASDGSQTLRGFSAYRRDNIIPRKNNDNGHLIT